MKKSVSKELADLRHSIHTQGKLDTLKTLIARSGETYGDRLAIVEKKQNQLIKHTTSELYESINALGTALIDMGFKGKNIAILGEGSFNWILSFFAVVCGVGVAVPIDKDMTDAEISRLISKADCEAVFFSRTYIKAVKTHIKNDDRVKLCVTMSGKCDGDGFVSIDRLIEKGRRLLINGRREYIDADIKKDDIAAIIFTSGTTGANKGVMLSHYNFASNVDGICDTIEQEATSFSVLPMNHVYELSCNILVSVYVNAVIFINDSLRNVFSNIQHFRTDGFNCVPLILEGIYNSIWTTAEKKGYDRALRGLIKISNFFLNHGVDLRDIFFRKIRKNFGDSFPTLVCGGAPPRLEHIKGLYALGFNIYQGYGLTESSPIVTLNLHAGIFPESSGYAFPKAQFQIHNPDEDGIGEIWIKGDNLFKGYYKDIEATKASFDGEWFKTGDYGRTNSRHELFVVGRKKNLIILDNGKNVFPEDIESRITENIKYVREAVAFESFKEVLGKRHKMIAVGIYVDRDDFPGKTQEEIVRQVSDDVSSVNRLMSSYKRVQDIMVVYEEFPKTSTKKVIRQKVIKQYNEIMKDNRGV